MVPNVDANGDSIPVPQIPKPFSALDIFSLVDAERRGSIAKLSLVVAIQNDIERQNREQCGFHFKPLAVLDTGLVVGNGTTAFGTPYELLTVNTVADRTRAQFGLAQSGTTDKADFQVGVQHSDDGAAWPDSDQWSPIFAWPAVNAGDDLTRSKFVLFVPRGKWFRFVFINANGTDSFTVDSKIGEVYSQGQTVQV